MTTVPAYELKKKYDHLFNCDPLTANVFLLLCELADDNGQVHFNTDKPEKDILQLLSVRFDDPRGYQL